MKILVIAPHMDDEALGCGGTIARHVAEGDDVHVLFIAHRIYAHKFDKTRNETEKEHARRAKAVLGYREATFLDLNDERLDLSVQEIIIRIEECVSRIKPEVVYCPFKGDNHQDHRAVFDAVRVALRPQSTNYLTKLLMYEVPSSTEQSPPLIENVFLPNYYTNITSFIAKKIEAIGCYETETRLYPHPRSKEAIEILARKRGIETGFIHAEAFMILRDRWE